MGHMLFTLGEVSLSTTVSRVRGGGPPTGESGMKEDQYPYRVRFSTHLTTPSKEYRAPSRTRLRKYLTEKENNVLLQPLK